MVTVELSFQALLRFIPGDPVLGMRLSVFQALVQERLLPVEKLSVWAKAQLRPRSDGSHRASKLPSPLSGLDDTGDLPIPGAPLRSAPGYMPEPLRGT